MNTINWPNRGIATQLEPRGMSDYQREEGNSMFETPEGFRLKNTRYGWQAQHRGFTTHWKPTYQEAIDALENMIDECKG
jgi:hypothetical protein